MIEVHNLKKSYSALTVLDNVDLTVQTGEVVALVGPSGSGKSTLLRCINFLDQPDAGRIVIDGDQAFFDMVGGRLKLHGHRRIAAVRARLGMVFQDFNLFPHMNILANVMEGPVRVLRRPKDQVRAEALVLLERVGLAERANHFPDQLSGGQKQRAAIARALAMKPTAMLFDEPTSALDPELVQEVLTVIRDLRDLGMTMIIVTHEMRFARDVANRIAFLDKGRIVEISAPGAFFSGAGDPRKLEFLQHFMSS